MHAVNLPNAITVARIALIPVVVLAMLDARRGGSPALAAGLVGVAAVSDALDGHLARRRDSVTNFGAIVDPIADKALIAGALAVLVVQDRVALWVAAAIVAREVAVTSMRFVVGRRGVVISAGTLGKRKALLQIVAVVALILAPDPWAVWAQVLVYAALLLTLVSGVQYFVGLGRRLAEPAEEEPGSREAGPAPSADDQLQSAPMTGALARRSNSSSREAPRR
jgi:CDP-diacylglycerol---glycerol-3-phosphate 3-phosphatidyltransferase